MNSRQKKTLAAIFETPTRSDVEWDAVESLFRALGAQVKEGSGSRIKVTLSGEVRTFHRPHPEPTTDKGALKAVREFLSGAGVRPQEEA